MISRPVRRRSHRSARKAASRSVPAAFSKTPLRVLGLGTGLGVAGLVHAQHSWIPVPGEGGYIDVGPRTERDYQIWPFLELIEGRISAEQLLCGRGIMNIYRAVCESKACIRNCPTRLP